MADDRKGTINAASDGGVSGEHAAAETFKFLVGPTTTDQFNTARLRLIPIACWRVDDVRFAFDSSFVNADPTDPDNPNDIRAELKHLVDLIKAHPGSPLSVFGHADPVGSDDYNKQLSGRRAKVIYGLLISNTDPGSAVKLWQDVSQAEAWGANQRQAMQAFTGLPSGTPDSTLFRSYMQKLCPSDLKLTKKDFLAQGADGGGKGDFQGCSEFNPVLIFSQEKQEKFDQAKQKNDKPTLAGRNAQNAPNRRVMVLMFRKGSRVDPAKWPCPRATEGVSNCKKRFWSDGEKRRSTHLSGNDRKFEMDKGTFACRFYQRISDGSPCTAILTGPWILTGQWLDTQVFCGDSAKLQITVTPTPPNGNVTVEVVHPSTGATIDTLTGTLTGGTVQLTWIAKAQTANWRTDKISFRATALSVAAKGISSNQLTFRHRPTTSWTLINVSHASGNGFAPVVEKHDAQLEADQVHYRLKLRSFGDPFDATKQAAAKSVIENVWNNGFASKKFHRKSCKRGQSCDCAFDCCKAKFHLDVNFVASGEHVPVQIFATAPGSPRHRSRMGGTGGEWGDPPINASSTYAHETGHVLGQYDEYPSGAIDPGSPPAQPSNATTPNLLSTSGNTTLLNRHYRWVLAFLNKQSDGDPYEIVPPGE